MSFPGFPTAATDVCSTSTGGCGSRSVLTWVSAKGQFCCQKCGHMVGNDKVIIHSQFRRKKESIPMAEHLQQQYEKVTGDRYGAL